MRHPVVIVDECNIHREWTSQNYGCRKRLPQARLFLKQASRTARRLFIGQRRHHPGSMAA
jgi:hypothetical protein